MMFQVTIQKKKCSMRMQILPKKRLCITKYSPVLQKNVVNLKIEIIDKFEKPLEVFAITNDCTVLNMYLLKILNIFSILLSCFPFDIMILSTRSFMFIFFSSLTKSESFIGFVNSKKQSFF